ncbi:MFS transporter [Colletotrichum falcatum]|nr:MFS transporter [Colletotrichum falcatum]
MPPDTLNTSPGCSAAPDTAIAMPRVSKELYFGTLLYGACIAGAVGPLLIPGFSVVAAQFHISLAQVTILNGVLVMALGISAYLCAPLANCCGRRAIYLATTVFMTTSCVWASYTRTYGSLLGSRALQGLGLGGFMSLAGTASINDVFARHEVGRRVGVWNFAVLLSVNLTPVISGYVITALGWRWSFRILAVASGLLLLLAFLFVPETLVERDILHGVPGSAEQDQQLRDKDIEARSKIPKGTAAPERTHFLGLHRMRRESFRRLPAMIASSFKALGHPVVIWASAMWSVFFTWVIIQGAVADQIYTTSPYNLPTATVGILIGVPPLIGSALGTVLGGWSSDRTVDILVRRNNDIYEPEFRLLLIGPGTVCCALGAYGLGAAVSAGSSVWVSAVLLGVLNFGVGLGCTGIVAYTNDSLGPLAADCMGIAMLIKSCFAFGISFILNGFYAQRGPTFFFATWASLTVGVALTTVPLYMFGKKIRE